MADVDVTVTDVAIIRALNTPGGDVFNWRDEVMAETVRIAEATSPVNDILNTLGPGHAPPGEYIASWGADRIGSNGHEVRATIYNSSDHADIVEYGRSISFGYERFSWTGHSPPGAVDVHQRGTRGRDGQHVLANATAAAVGASLGAGGFSMTVAETEGWDD